MIFQAGFDIEIKKRNIQAIIDFDTGLVGFIEKIENKTIEFNYYNCPPEFRIAFYRKLENLISTDNNSNTEICRKSEIANVLRKYFKENN